ncbi:MAG: Glycerophosphoryl diester phosphodiesterase family [Candidatus Parcubacteria bacterium]|jgi:hypothetical protein
MVNIITHRGLEPSKPTFYSESSYEAFADHLQRGFGIEFDPNFLLDGNIVLAHDSSLSRMSNGKDTRPFAELKTEDVQTIILPHGRLCFFAELMEMIESSVAPVHSLHFKGIFQEQLYADVLLSHLETVLHLLPRIILFDVKPDIAAYMKAQLPTLLLAPSVAHTYDIERYNNAVHGTLLSVEEALRYKNIYDWVWLDEWDLQDKDGGQKQFYTKETFETLKHVGYKISLVTPELHGTSPGLLGGEAHPDAKDKQTLFNRIKEILDLQPDAVCTDYPEEVRAFY